MTVDEAVKKAIAEEGIMEYPSNSNKVKYNTEYYGREVSGSAYPWCCTFVWWVLRDLIPKTALCAYLGEWFKKQNRWYTEAQVGDVVFFKFNSNNRWTNHVGIVVGINGNTIETIEGNTSVSSNDNGGKVMRRVRASNIVGYGRPNYENVVSEKTYIQGIDISSNQGFVDFAKVKGAGVQFVCLRSTTKSNNPDTKFEVYLKNVLAQRLDYCCYKYAYAKTIEDAVKEAESVINLLHGRKMMIWYDVEDKSLEALGREKIGNLIKEFCRTCTNAGYDVGIYCNANWYNNFITSDLKKKYLFWVARYGKNTGYLDENYKPKGNIYAWQYTSKGHVDGITGYVDRDVIL